MNRAHTLFRYTLLLFILVGCTRVPFVPEGPVALLLGPPGLLSLTNPTTTISVSNPGTDRAKWFLRVRQNNANPTTSDWFTLSLSEGFLEAGQITNITLTLKDNLDPGLYKASLSFRHKDQKQSYQVLGLIGSGGFALEAQANSGALTAINKLTLPLSILGQDGFTGEVTLSIIGAPSGISSTFSPNPATLQSTLELSTDGSTAPGNYVLAIQGTSGELTATTTVSILVATNNTEPGFSLALEKPVLELAVANTVTANVRIQRSGGFATPVAITAENVPAGMTVTFTPNPGTNQTTLTFQAASDTLKGNYLITLKGQADSLESSTTLSLTITADKSARLSGVLVTDNARISTSNFSLAAPAFESSIDSSPKPLFVPGQLLVKYKEVSSGELSTLAENRQRLSLALKRDYGVRVVEIGLPGQHDLLETSQDVLALAQQLKQDPRVEYAEPNYLLYPLELPNDSEIQQQWSLPVAGLPVAWNLETGSSNPVTIAVIDTGFDLNHPDLKGRFLPGYDFCAKTGTVTINNKDSIVCLDETDSNPTFDNPNNNHGTHVAGLAAASGNNAEGIAGAAYGSKVKILPVKIFDSAGRLATVDGFIKGIRWAVGLEVKGIPINPNPARIVSLSLGGSFKSDSLQNAVDEAYQAGALILAATGNGSSDSILSPAAANHVLAIGSVDQDFRRSSFSNYSAKLTNGPGTVDLMAPGGGSIGGLLSTVPNGYGFLNGTSMSTPVAAGIAALVLSQSPGLSVDALENKLLQAVYFDTTFMNAIEYGKGVLRADLALGLPGPGSDITVILSGPSTMVKTVKLTLDGKSEPFNFEGLEPGNYRLELLANGSGAQLAKSTSFSLMTDEHKTLEVSVP
jgi:serine protease